MAPTANEAVETYFAAVTNRDPEIANLFTEDASLIGLGTIVTGRPAIAEFYAASIGRGSPVPELLGPLLTDGPRVAAEIRIALSGAPPMHVVDLFVVDDGLISSLTYFVADHP